MASSDQSQRSGQVISLTPVQTALAPRVLAKTERWLVLDKPAGWLTIPGRAPGVLVVSEWAQAEHGPLWVVHRLDRDTSGVLLLARAAEAHREANGWFQRHQVRKIYDFLAQGSMSMPMERIQSPVNGARSITQVERREIYSTSVAEGSACFLGRALPQTGRRHQIRIHLASRGHPLLGDVEYNGPERLALKEGSTLEVNRVALHAARLELPTGEAFEAPWPEDFEAWVRILRGVSP